MIWMSGGARIGDFDEWFKRCTQDEHGYKENCPKSMIAGSSGSFKESM